MTERKAERAWADEIYGRENTVAEMSKKIAATIFHSVILHSPPHDKETIEGIERTLLKLTTKEELEKLRVLHNAQDEHNL
jgi:hypothetical protein